MERRRPPETAAGYYVLHDFRRIDWEAWNHLSTDDRKAMIDEVTTFLSKESASEEGDLACFSVLGHKADLLILVLRPTLEALDRIERQLHRLTLSSITERATSAVGVTEASGYTEGARAFFDDGAEPDPGLKRYMETRLYPSIPTAEFVSFYFMNKRRHPDANWYDLPYEERVEHITSHGDIGREYAGRVTQMITGTTGFDDWEWGVTLFANDMVAIKDLLVEMRFDPSTSKFAEFGPFYVGRQFAVGAFDQFLAGERVGIGEEDDEPETDLSDVLEEIDVAIDAPSGSHGVLVYSDAPIPDIKTEIEGLRANFDHYDSHIETTVAGTDGSTVAVSLWTTGRAADTASGFLQDLPAVTEVVVGAVSGTSAPTSADETTQEIRSTLEEEGVYSGVPHGEEIHALVLYSEAETNTLTEAVSNLTEGFDRYDTHEGTSVYVSPTTDRKAIVSLWETETAAETASGYLRDLPGVYEREEADEGFGTMGMFYRTKPDHREDFRETFAEVGGLLDEMEGHRETDLFANVEDENDMFIASHWRSKDDAMDFFRSDAFSETIQWGREILADRPRHVFLA